MNKDLNIRWQNAKRPFDAQILHPSDLMPLSMLRVLLHTIVQVLHSEFGQEKLYRFEDWHEHDGYITRETLVSWKSLDEILSSNESLYSARHDDTFVHWAYYPAGLSFLLRFDVLDENEDELYPGIWGTFDVSTTSPLLQKVEAALSKEPAHSLLKEEAKSYFDENYAG